MDVRTLICEVAARNHIRLEEDDPAFALVTLNQLVLEHVAAELLQQVRSSINDFEQSALRVQGRMGGLLAQELKRAITKAQAEHDTRRESAGVTDSAMKWICVGAGSALACFILGLIAGGRVL